LLANLRKCKEVINDFVQSFLYYLKTGWYNLI